jgi:large conductance mechanosensitive channel
VLIHAAFATVVKAFTEDILTPLIAAFGGRPDFSEL